MKTSIDETDYREGVDPQIIRYTLDVVLEIKKALVPRVFQATEVIIVKFVQGFSHRYRIKMVIALNLSDHVEKIEVERVYDLPSTSGKRSPANQRQTASDFISEIRAALGIKKNSVLRGLADLEKMANMIVPSLDEID